MSNCYFFVFVDLETLESVLHSYILLELTVIYYQYTLDAIGKNGIRGEDGNLYI